MNLPAIEHALNLLSRETEIPRKEIVLALVGTCFSEEDAFDLVPKDREDTCRVSGVPYAVELSSGNEVEPFFRLGYHHVPGAR